MERPLPDEVARTARAYLAALLPSTDVSDAWHELVADVDYWGDRDLVPVVRLAHQVVLQHQRLTPEVAVLALAEVGIDDPASIAAVLDADPAQVADWADQVSTRRDGDPAPVTSTDEPPSWGDVGHPVAVEDGGDGEDAAMGDPAGEAVRIGFDDDEPLSDLGEGTTVRTGRRDLLLAAAALAIVLMVLWLLTGR